MGASTACDCDTTTVPRDDFSSESTDVSPEEIDFSPEEETQEEMDFPEDSSPEVEVVDLVVGSAKGSWLVGMVMGFGPLFCCKLSLRVFSSLKNFSLSTRRG